MNENEKDYRLSIGFPLDMGKTIRTRAKENGRSFAKEVVQIVKAQLEQESRRESLDTTPKKGKNV